MTTSPVGMETNYLVKQIANAQLGSPAPVPYIPFPALKFLVNVRSTNSLVVRMWVTTTTNTSWQTESSYFRVKLMIKSTRNTGIGTYSCIIMVTWEVHEHCGPGQSVGKFWR